MPKFKLIYWCGKFVETALTRKLGEIKLFYAVNSVDKYLFKVNNKDSSIDIVRASLLQNLNWNLNRMEDRILITLGVCEVLIASSFYLYVQCFEKYPFGNYSGNYQKNPSRSLLQLSFRFKASATIFLSILKNL